MYDIALSVEACLQGGTRVHVAWVVDTGGYDAARSDGALAITPGGGRVGSLLGGAVHDQLAELAAAGVRGRLVDLRVSEVDALVAGLPGPADVRCVLVDATDLPGELWEHLRRKDPLCLVARTEEDAVVDVALFTAETVAAAGDEAGRLFALGASGSAVADESVVTVLWPVPSLVVVGAGPNVRALGEAAQLLGWQVRVVEDAATATGLVAGLTRLDSVVVASHDDDVSGAVLTAALGSAVGYIGSLGPRRLQRSRADWLAYRGITDLARVHGPAGLDVGASTPAEVAVSVLAEALAVRSGSSARSADVLAPS